MSAAPIPPTALAGYAALLAARKAESGLTPMDALCAELGALLAGPCGTATLSRALREALAAGVAVARAESVLLHLAPYAGLAAAEAATGALEAVVAADPAWRDQPRLRLPPLPASRAGRIDAGFGHYRRFHPDRPEAQAPRFAPLSPNYYPGGMELMSHSFADPDLALREREIASIACLAALGCCPDQLAFHVEVGLREGITREQLAQVLRLVQVHAGVPRAHNAAALAAQLLPAGRPAPDPQET